MSEVRGLCDFFVVKDEGSGIELQLPRATAQEASGSISELAWVRRKLTPSNRIVSFGPLYIGFLVVERRRHSMKA